MKPAERVEAVLRREMVDKVPFTVYESKIPQCETERTLRSEDLCIVNRRYPVYKAIKKNVREESYHFEKDGDSYVKTIYNTPEGELSSIQRKRGGQEWTSWTTERIFKSTDDYDAIECMIRDTEYVPDYEAFLKAKEWMGGDVFLRADIPGVPLHAVMYSFMGLEMFSVEWVERRERILRLCDALYEEGRKICSIVAASPALAANAGGNYTPEVMGRERLVEYALPYLNEAAETLHRGGKLIGCHLDGNNKLWAAELAKSKLDYIEAFTPSPDTDMSVREARAIWRDKILWINFPSSVHLSDAGRIEEVTKRLLQEAAPGDRFLIGITEDVPEDRWQESFLTISRTIEKYGHLPIKTR